MTHVESMVMLAAGKASELPEGAAGQFIESCYSMLAGRFDPTLGGFGAAPKFPRPAEINLLLVEHLRASQGREASSATASSSGKPTRRTPLAFGARKRRG